MATSEDRDRRDQESRLGGLEDRVSQLESKMSKIDDRLKNIDRKLSSTSSNSSRNDSGRSQREGRRDLSYKKSKINHSQDVIEETLLRDVKKGIREVKDRLTTYGKMQQQLHKLYEKVDQLETEIVGKVGRTEFEEHKREMDENIRRVKSQLDML